MADPYHYWREALAGKEIGSTELPLSEGDVHAGFWRKRNSKAGTFSPVAIWFQDGNPICLVNGQPADAAETFSYCTRFPISEAQYRARMETGKWFDEDDAVTASLSPPPIGDNRPDDLEVLKDQIASALQGVDQYATVGDEETAAKAQSLRSRLLELSRTADKTRETEKAPFLEGGKAVDARYQPLVKGSKEGADKIARALSAYATQKQREADAAARKAAEEASARAAEAAKHAPIGAEPEPPAPAPAPAPAPLKGAYGRAASQRKVKVFTMTDQDAVYACFRVQPEVTELLQRLAQKSTDAGFTVPGGTVEEIIKVV